MTLYSFFGVTFSLIKYFEYQNIYEVRLVVECSQTASSMESQLSGSGSTPKRGQSNRSKRRQGSSLIDEEEERNDEMSIMREREMALIMVEQVFNALNRMKVAKQRNPA